MSKQAHLLLHSNLVGQPYVSVIRWNLEKYSTEFFDMVSTWSLKETAVFCAIPKVLDLSTFPFCNWHGESLSHQLAVTCYPPPFQNVFQGHAQVTTSQKKTDMMPLKNHMIIFAVSGDDWIFTYMDFNRYSIWGIELEDRQTDGTRDHPMKLAGGRFRRDKRRASYSTSSVCSLPQHMVLATSLDGFKRGLTNS